MKTSRVQARMAPGKPRSPISLRLPEEEEAYYRRMASQHGVSLSVFLGKLLIAGVVAESVLEVEQRMRALIGLINGRAAHDGASDDMLLSLLTCEALLSMIVEAQDVQSLYRAQEVARDKLRKLRGG